RVSWLPMRTLCTPPTLLSLASPVDPRALHPFPTRRSSDLRADAARGDADRRPGAGESDLGGRRGRKDHARARRHQAAPRAVRGRSEEHTSELQSPDHLVCRLLLAKKTKQPYIYTRGFPAMA